MSTSWVTLVVGQSLALGDEATPAVLDVCDSPWVRGLTDEGITWRIDRSGVDEQHPDVALGDTIADAARRTIVGTFAQGGATYDQLKRGTATYQAALDAVAAAVEQAAEGERLIVDAIHIIHGESDNGALTAEEYAAALVEWRDHLTEDLAEITGQRYRPYAFVSQVSASGTTAAGAKGACCGDDPRMVLVGPRWPLPYGSSPHLTAAATVDLGRLHGRAHRQVLVDREPWVPLAPAEITAPTASTVVVRWHVPVEPIVIDGDHGLTIYDDDSPVSIDTVTVTGDDEITIALDAPASGLVEVAHGPSDIADSTTSDPGPNRPPLFRLPVGHEWQPPAVGWVPVTRTGPAGPVEPQIRAAGAASPLTELSLT